MRRCRVCQHDKALDEFESVRGKTRRYECKHWHCRREERQQRAMQTDRSDTASLVSGGIVHADEQSDGHDLEDQLRHLSADLRNLRESAKSDAQRLVQLEIGIQNQRESDPLWNIVLIVTLSTCTFIILQWIERQLTVFRQARAEDNRTVA
jgi:hypothetical protein